MTRRTVVIENPNPPDEPAGSVRTEAGVTAESLFERICDNIGIRWERIEVGKQRTADYWIWLSDGTKAMAEVKQICMNEAEREHQARFDRGEVAAIGTTPGGRVRREIDHAKQQLRAAKALGCPAMVIIHNAVFLSDHTAPYHIRVAMYGEQQVILDVPTDPSLRARLRGSRFGGKRKVGPQHNTTLSAIGVLQSFTLDRITSTQLIIYHNRHAAVPLAQESLRRHGIRQFTIVPEAPNDFVDWTDVS